MVFGEAATRNDYQDRWRLISVTRILFKEGKAVMSNGLVETNGRTAITYFPNRSASTSCLGSTICFLFEGINDRNLPPYLAYLFPGKSKHNLTRSNSLVQKYDRGALSTDQSEFPVAGARESSQRVGYRKRCSPFFL